MDSFLAEAMGQLLADQCTSSAIRHIEASGSAQPLWQLIEESGFADALVEESQGGAGLTLHECFPIFELCGAYALPVPLAETMFARALLARSGITPPAGSITFGQGVESADGGLESNTVRCGRVADWVLISIEHNSLLLPVAQAVSTPAGFSLDATLAWPAGVRAMAKSMPCSYDLRVLQGCIYSSLLAGALMTVFNRTLQYANDRKQFGRSIGKFQAIQHQLSLISEHAFASRMAAQIGCHSATLEPDPLRVAVAKARSSEAARDIAALSHSIHGAIGFTEEFDLQLFTRRLHMWRQAGGSESYWHKVAGATLLDRHNGHALDLIRDITENH